MSPRTRALAPALHAIVFAIALTPPSLMTRDAHAQAPRPSGATASRAPQDLIARGQSLFEDQQYEESIQTLSAALVRPNNTKPQRIEIYRLLALNYITLNRKDEAESAVRGLLAIEPSYSLPPSESPRFRDFFASVRTKWEAEGRPGLVKESEPAPPPVTMKHSSPSEMEPNHAIDLTAHLSDPQHRVATVTLFYRAGSNGTFQETTATMGEGTVYASIPAASVKPPLVEYYFQGTDKAGLPVVSRGDATAPLRIAVPEAGNKWVLPVVITSAAVVVVGGTFLALVLATRSKGEPGPGAGPATVNVSVGESWAQARW